MSNPSIVEGKRAPAFTVPATGGERVRLTDYRGYWMVLFFYGKDCSVRCTKAMNEFISVHDELAENGAIVFGMGPGDLETHQEFLVQCKLPFNLLLDRDKKIARKYGVWREKRTQGRNYLGLVRSTFILDPSGIVVKVFDNVRTKNHGQKVLVALQAALQS